MTHDKVFHQLSEPQKAIWYMEKTYPGTSMNIISGTLRLKCRVDFRALEDAINIFIRDNDAVRLRIHEDGYEPKQYVSDYERQEFEFVDFSGVNGLEDMYAWDALQAKVPFEIIDAPLYCFKLVKVSEDDGGFLIRMHHLIADAWSMNLLAEQIIQNYEQITTGAEPDLERPSYLELIAEDEKYLVSDRFQRDKAYWEEKFAIFPEPTPLKKSTAVDVHTIAARKTLLTPEKLSNKIREFCRENNESIFTLFMAALSMYIFRVVGKDDIVVGTTVLNRHNRREKETVGMYVSIGAPARVKVQEDMDFYTLISLIAKENLSILRHQKYPFYQLLRDVKKKHNTADNLYDTVLSYQNTKIRKNQLNTACVTRWHFSGNQLETLAININDREDNGNLIIDYDFRCDVFNVKEIEFIHKHMISLLWHALDNPKKQISQLEMLSSIEHKLILNEFNRTDATFPADKTLHQIFEEQAAKTPERTAVISGNKKLTYREVNEKSNQLAKLLRNKGVKPDDVVGISLYRSEKMIIGLLAILKAGGAYLPIDPEFPDERKSYMLENSSAKLLLCSDASGIAGYGGECVIIEDKSIFCGDASNLSETSGPRNLAYVIYTSGSTGRPKGVMIEHRSIVNRLHWMQKAYPLNEESVILQKTRFTFDVSVWELFWWSFAGASVCMLKPGGEKEPETILEAVEQNNVTTMHFVPSMMAVFLDYIEKEQCAKRLASLRHVFASGEALGISHAEAFNSLLNAVNKTLLINLYGPTEAAVDVSHFNCSPSLSLKSVPIGKPIDNIRLYILDKYMSMVPVGVAGELYIGGVGVGRGYINNPELTQERFVANPYRPGDVLYRTGDRARWYPRGDIEYLGRIDFQVKIRGIRIELGEIENALRTKESVKDAVVTGVTYNDNTYLCAYIVTQSATDESEIKDYLSKKVPDYMIPSYIIFMEELPHLSNGKIDRNALPEPDFNTSASRDYVEPQTELEIKLAGLWRQLLKLKKVGIDDNFFNMGGDSLSAISLIVRIHKELGRELSVRDIFALKTIRQMAEFLEKAQTKNNKPIRMLEDQLFYPVSSAQKRLYILHEMYKDDISYNLPGIIELDSNIEVGVIDSVLSALIKRHETLRTSFDFIDGQPVQIVNQDVDFQTEFSKAPESAVDAEMAHFVRPFDLSRAPLMRARLVHVQNGKRLLFFDMHHIISDGTSMNILAREFNCLLGGLALPEQDIRYRDYAVWHNEMIESGTFDAQEEYWLKLFSNELPVLNLQTDYPRPLRRSFRGRKSMFKLGKEMTAGLRKITAETGTTLYMVLFAAFNVLLHRYTGQDDIVVGIPVEGRLNADLGTVVGMFVNMLAIRNAPCDDKTFLQFLQEVKENLLAAYENQEYPFEVLVEKARIRRDTGRNPIFDVSFVLQNFDLTQVTLTPYLGISSKFDLSLEAFDRGESIEMLVEYSTDLFEEETITRLSEHLSNALYDIVLSPWKKLADINMISDREKKLLLEQFSGADAGFPDDKTIHEIFASRAASTPENTAVISDGKCLTYKQLDERSNQLARLLRKKGVGPDKVVGISLYRSENMIVGLLGILKAGGAYLPIDPDYPEDRIEYMLRDSGAELLITQWDLLGRWKLDAELIDIDDEGIYHSDMTGLSNVNSPHDMAYVIYTSGSTGNPKGVMIEHRNVVRLLFNDRLDFSFSDKDVWTMFHSFCFDFSVWEMYGALLYGGKLVIISKTDARDTQAFLRILKKEGVTVLNQTPGAFYNLVEEERKATDRALKLRYVIFGGEALKPILLKPFKRRYPETQLINMYGITETTVHVTYKQIDDDMMENNVSNIGRAIPTLRTYIVDRNMKLQPVGIPGELCVSGDGVARGYLNNEPFTKIKFVASPFEEGKILYRSGDLARMLPNGEMEYLGRIDTQVKVRGYRVELGEIENAMMQYPGIREAVVTAIESEQGIKKLYAYYLSNSDITNNELREHLHKRLPDYMIPSYLVKLDELPLNKNGKIDKERLPTRIEAKAVEMLSRPKNDLEEMLLKIWQKVLFIENISVNDDFFELGGDSLSAIKVLASLPEEFSGVTLVDFYNHPTIQQIAGAIAENKIESKNILLRLSPSKSKTTVDIVCFPYGGGNAVSYRDLSDSLTKISDKYAIYSIYLPGHDLCDEKMIDIKEAAGKIVQEINKKDSKELILYSHCVGSALLFETVRLLEAESKKISKIIIGGILPPKYARMFGRFYDPWMLYSKKGIIAYLERIGLEKSALENRYVDTVIKAFRHDARCFYRYFHDRSKDKNISIHNKVEFVFGECDQVTRHYEKEYKKWRRFVEEARMHVIKNASHYFLNTHSDQLAEIIIK